MSNKNESMEREMNKLNVLIREAIGSGKAGKLAESMALLGIILMRKECGSFFTTGFLNQALSEIEEEKKMCCFKNRKGFYCNASTT
jgi:hypothetical protein